MGIKLRKVLKYYYFTKMDKVTELEIYTNASQTEGYVCNLKKKWNVSHSRNCS